MLFTPVDQAEEDMLSLRNKFDSREAAKAALDKMLDETIHMTEFINGASPGQLYKVIPDSAEDITWTKERLKAVAKREGRGVRFHRNSGNIEESTDVEGEPALYFTVLPKPQTRIRKPKAQNISY